MAQIDLLQGFISPDLLGQRRHLLLGQHVLGQVDFAQGQDREQFCDGVPGELIIVQVDVLKVRAILDGLHQDFHALVVDLVISQVQLGQRVAFLDELGDLLGSY